MIETDKKKIIEEAKKRGLLEPTEVTEFHTVVAKGFPKFLFDLWKKQCVAQYNDIYWAKMWSDHLKAQAYDNLIGMAVSHAPASNETDENDISLIGDGVG